MQNPLDSAYCIASQIASATKRAFYLYLQQTTDYGNDIFSFRRESVGGKLNEAIRRICLEDMMLLTNHGSKHGITPLGTLSSRIGGVRNDNLTAIVYGWDEGGKVDQMLSLFFCYCLANPVLLTSMFFNHENLEDRDNTAEQEALLYGPYKHKIEGFYDTKTFQFSKVYKIDHRFNSGFPHDSIAIWVSTENPEAMVKFIASNSGLFITDFVEGEFSIGLLLEGKRLEIVAKPRLIPKK